MTPLPTLQHIADRLADTPPLDVINELSPKLKSDAISWARHLPAWDEYRGQASDQVLAIARTVSRRAMKAFNLEIDREGRVAERQERWSRPDEMLCSFPMKIGEETVEVRFMNGIFSTWVSFIGQNLGDHYKPHPLSSTGWWSTNIPADALEAIGGAEAFAQQYAEAKIAGREMEFLEQFEGKAPEPKRKKKPVVGKHTAEAEKQGPQEGLLF